MKIVTTSEHSVNFSIAPHVAELIELIGEPVLLLPWPTGTKGTKKKWGHLTADAMRDPEHLAELGRGNIGAALGAVSDDLITIDIDDDNEWTEFIQLNPTIADTLSSRGRRGGNNWYRMLGPYPAFKKLKRNGADWGEWRAKGAQTIIYGKHPSGRDYEITNKKPPQLIEYSQIQWPVGVTLPPLQMNTDADGGEQMHTDSDTSVGFCGPLCSSVSSIDDAVRVSLPTAPGHNHAALFKFARAVKTIEARNGPLSMAEKLEAFSQWHTAAEARSILRPTQYRDEYLAEFLRAYERAKYPLGLSPVVLQAWQKAMSEPPPSSANVFTSPQAKLLVSICLHLHILADGKEWYLPCRVAGGLIGVSHSIAANYLSAMVRLEILSVVQPGTTTKAPRYSYAAPL